MVEFVKTTAGNQHAKAGPLIVELIGPAGAGKTTICRELAQSDTNIGVGSPPQVRNPASLSFFARNILSLFPLLCAALLSNSPRTFPSRREVAWLATLNGWHHLLQRREEASSNILILDQGPVFLMTRLHEFGPVSLISQDFQQWWDDIYSRWADTLDVLVLLEASDVELVRRIRNRSKHHEVKGRSDSDIIRFLAAYRTGYKRVISALARKSPHLRIIQLDTNKVSCVEVIRQLHCVFGLNPCESETMHRIETIRSES